MKWLAIAVALSLLAQLCSRRAAKSGARNLHQMSEILYTGAHEYRETSAANYEHVDATFYAMVLERFQAAGFEFLGDVEDVTSTLAGPGRPTPIRVLVGDDGTVVVGAYHLKVGGWIGAFLTIIGKNSLRIVDLETAFSSGRILVTSTAELVGGLDSPPEIEPEYLPYSTTLEVLLERHRAKRASWLSAGADVQAQRCRTIVDVLRLQEQLDQIKSRFRLSRRGRFTADEMSRVSGPGTRAASEELAKEMAKLQE